MRKSTAIVLTTLAILVARPFTASAGPLIVTPNGNGAQLVAALLSGAGITVVPGSQTYTGVAVASGTFTGGTGIIPFDAGVLLTSGFAANAVGPNNSGAITGESDPPTAGDPDLDALVGGVGTLEAAVLEFDFIPDTAVISFQYVFGSEEYNFFVGSSFNDVFGFFLNGVNIATLPGTNTAVAINNVNCNTNSQYYTSNNSEASGFVGGHPCGDAGLNTQYDGLVGAASGFPLFAIGSVTPGAVNHIKLAVADTSDQILDAGVFLKAGSFVSAPPGETTPPPAVVPEPATLLLLGSGLVGLAARRRHSKKQ